LLDKVSALEATNQQVQLERERDETESELESVRVEKEDAEKELVRERAVNYPQMRAPPMAEATTGYLPLRAPERPRISDFPPERSFQQEWETQGIPMLDELDALVTKILPYNPNFRDSLYAMRPFEGQYQVPTRAELTDAIQGAREELLTHTRGAEIKPEQIDTSRFNTVLAAVHELDPTERNPLTGLPITVQSVHDMTAQLEQRGRELQDLRTQQGYQLDALIAEAISLDPNSPNILGGFSEDNKPNTLQLRAMIGEKKFEVETLKLTAARQALKDRPAPTAPIPPPAKRVKPTVVMTEVQSNMLKDLAAVDIMIRTPSNRSDAEIGKATRDIGLLMGGVKKNLITTEQDFIAAAADMSPWMASMIRSAMETPELHRRVLPEGETKVIPFPERPLSPGETATLAASERLASDLSAVPPQPQSPRAKTPEPVAEEDKPVLDFLSARQAAMKRPAQPATGALAPRGVPKMTIQGQTVVRTEVLPKPPQPFQVHSIPVRKRSPGETIPAPPAKRPKTEEKAVHDTRVLQIIDETIPTPASNDSQQEMNEIALKSKKDALEKAEIEQQQQDAALNRLQQRVRSRSASLRRRQQEHDAAAAVTPDPSLEISTVERAKRLHDSTQAAIDAELAKMASLGAAVMTREELAMTDDQREALYKQFHMDDMPSEDTIREIQAREAQPETADMRRRREEDVRRREDVTRTAVAVEQGQVQRTEASQAVTSAGVVSRRLGEDVATETAAVESARRKADEDAIQRWKSESVLDSKSRRLPSGVKPTRELDALLKQRKKLWRIADTGAGGRRVTSTNSDFDKWLADQSDSKVLTKAKSSYRGVIGTFEPATSRGKSLHRSLADRISRIERRIKGIRSGSIQKSQISGSARSRSREPQDVPKKKKKRKIAITGEAVAGEPPKKARIGQGFSKKRKKVNKKPQPPSVSRYFI